MEVGSAPRADVIRSMLSKPMQYVQYAQGSFKFGQVRDNTPRVQQTLSEPEDLRTFLPE